MTAKQYHVVKRGSGQAGAPVAGDNAMGPQVAMPLSWSAPRLRTRSEKRGADHRVQNPLTEAVRDCRAAGAEIAIIEPDEASRAAIGSNRLGPSTRTPATEAGRNRGTQAANRVESDVRQPQKFRLFTEPHRPEYDNWFFIFRGWLRRTFHLQSDSEF